MRNISTFFKSGLVVYISLLAGGCSHSKNLTGKYADKPESVSLSVLRSGYDLERKNLMKDDSLAKIDAAVMLTREEQLADRKLCSLRAQMLDSFGIAHFYPFAHPYFLSENAIFSDKLYHVLHKMPKGGLLHLHPSAGVSYHWMVDRVVTEADCYVYWDSSGDAKYIKGEIHFFKKNSVPKGFSLASDLQKADGHFKEQLLALLKFDQRDMKDSVPVWGEFEKRFKRVSGFVGYQPVFIDLVKSMFDSLVADGITHVELRQHVGSTLYDLDSPAGIFNADSVIHYYQLAARYIRDNKEPGFSFDLIYTNVRKRPLKDIESDMVNAFRLRSQYPDVIKGYDLVAEEDAGNTGLFYRDAYLMRDSLSKIYKIDMPLTLHAGESTWEHNHNIYDAVLVNVKRIGHGVNLFFFPALEKEVKKRDICIEINPVSNQLLGFVADLRMHPAHALVNHGIQVSVSSDDPSIFNYTGVSLDYWSIFLAWEMDLKMMKKIVMNSLDYSLLEGEQKEKAKQVWQDKWALFIQYVNETL